MPIPPPPKQIGGDHYSKHAGVQPIELIEAMKLGFHDGNAIKYLARYRNTGNLDDLHKAIWYIERLIAIEEAQLTDTNNCQGDICEEGHTYQRPCQLATGLATGDKPAEPTEPF